MEKEIVKFLIFLIFLIFLFLNPSSWAPRVVS
jgi:hypothetical protein